CVSYGLEITRCDPRALKPTFLQRPTNSTFSGLLC
ncbi:MAG: hypothetical protein ACI9KS_002417, partial [Sulfitobacter sp.]